MIDIVFPDGDDVRTAIGTKVFTSSGHEVEGVSRIEIDINGCEILLAKITVPIRKCDVKSFVAALGYESLSELARASGYELKLIEKSFLGDGVVHKGVHAV